MNKRVHNFIVPLVFFYLSGCVFGLDNGLGLTPPMGWMHWQRFRCLIDCDNYPDECISEKLFRSIADRMVEDGYLAAGYEYVMIDDCWASKKRNGNGKLEADPQRFPSGIKNLSDYVSNLGYPGSKDHLQVDADTFAEWGVDYLKLDGCHIDYTKIEIGYIEMQKHLNKTGRPIMFSCSWPDYQEEQGMKVMLHPWYPKHSTYLGYSLFLNECYTVNLIITNVEMFQSNYTALQQTCNLWRNWKDIEDEWASVTGIVDWFAENQDRLAPFAGPGHWNDPDMLIIGDYGLSYEQSKAQMAIWAIMAAPLIMSVDLRTIEPKFRDILLNKDIIAVNQDRLGIQGRFILRKDKIDIWTKPVLPKEEGGHSYAIALMSRRVDGYPYRLNFTMAELGIKNPNGFILKDLYKKDAPLQEINDSESIIIRIKPSGGEILLATAKPSSTPATVEGI
nr:unnamed protein product [Callosobruchus chinensis]